MGRSEKGSRRGAGRKKSGSCGGPGLGTPPSKCLEVEASIGRSQTRLSVPAGRCSKVPGKALEARVCRKP